MEATEKLSITVTADQARRIRELVEHGGYASVSEVLRAGLRALDRDEEDYRRRMESIRHRVREALDDPRPRLSSEEMKERLQEMYDEAEAEEAAKLRAS